MTKMINNEQSMHYDIRRTYMEKKNEKGKQKIFVRKHTLAQRFFREHDM